MSVGVPIVSGTHNEGFWVEAMMRPHVPEQRAHLFTCLDGTSTEHEYLSLVTAFVRCLKPRRILETGTHFANGTLAICAGLEANGVGTLTTIEMDEELHRKAKEKVGRCFPSVPVEFVHANSLDYFGTPKLQPFDFAFLDSALAVRAQELGVLLDTGLIEHGSMVMIHDTSRCGAMDDGAIDPENVEYHRNIGPVVRRHPGLGWIRFPLSRGLTVYQAQYVKEHAGRQL